LGLKSTKDT